MPNLVPVVMYGCESWTLKKAEHQRIAKAPKLWPPDAKSRLIGTGKASCWETLKAGGEGRGNRE